MKAKKDNEIWAISHLNECHFVFFNDSGELKKIQGDNHVLNTLGRAEIGDGSKKSFKKFYGKMFKIDTNKEFAFWKMSNTIIEKLNLKTKKKETFKYSLKKEDDYIIDFDIDEKNKSLYALTYMGELLYITYDLKNSSGQVSFTNERASNDHFYTCLKISQDFKFMSLGSYVKSEQEPSDIRVKLYMIMEINETNPKIVYCDEKLIPRERESGKHEYIQCLEYTFNSKEEVYLSVFLRRSCQVLVFEVKESVLRGPVYESPKISPEMINDVTSINDRIYICFSGCGEIAELKMIEG